MSTIMFPTEAVLASMTEDKWVKGWGYIGNPHAPTCLHGHIRRCALVPGDACLIQQVFRSGPGSIGWHDAPDRTLREVRSWVETADVTDEILAATFGPQWSAVVGIVRTLAAATETQLEDLAEAYAASGAALYAGRSAARNASRDAARDRDAAWNAATNAAWDAVSNATRNANAAADPARYTARGPARNAARDAGSAVSCHDLIDDTTEWNQAAYTLLVGPYTEVFGDPLTYTGKAN